jgi:hypothetical protein
MKSKLTSIGIKPIALALSMVSFLTAVDCDVAQATITNFSAACRAAYGMPTKYETIQMIGSYREGDVRREVPYIKTTEERNEHRLQVIDGQFFWSDGTRLAHTDNAFQREIFVMDVKGDFYALNPHDQALDKTKVHHSTFLAGGEVAMAGTFTFRQGRLEAVDTESGHYRCPDQMLVQAKLSLEEKGLDVSAIVFKRPKTGQVDVSNSTLGYDSHIAIFDRKLRNLMEPSVNGEFERNKLIDLRQALELSVNNNNRQLDYLTFRIWRDIPENLIETDLLPHFSEKIQSIVRAAKPRSERTQPFQAPPPAPKRGFFKSLLGR